MKKLYYNGTIVTMEDQQGAQAVVTDGGKIVFVGDYDRALAVVGHGQQVDLAGKTLLPAFIDGHSHFSAMASAQFQVSLEECANFAQIGEKIREFIRQKPLTPGQWVVAKGYDHNSLEEKIHPKREVLDEICPENPLLLQHASGHVGVLNTLGLEALGITAKTLSPAGGLIEIQGGQPTGYLEENAFIDVVKQTPMPDEQELLQAYVTAQETYASYGITTIQEGMAVAQITPLYHELIERNMLKLDVVAYADIQSAQQILSQFPKAVGRYEGNFKIGGYKIFLDGSPQGRTAWMLTEYENGEKNYYGYGTMEDKLVVAAVEKACADGLQLLAHCNGDAACDQYIRAVEQVNKSALVAKIRPVIIHAQLLAINQLDRVKKMGLLPSFFVGHVYHWGDIHRENFGRARAESISPTKSALLKNIVFTFHQDAPVIAPDMLFTVWCAVNRVSKHGETVGADQCISVWDALKAVTINSAYQYFEEDSKGSIKVGKNANFVILDQNPLTVDKMEIKNIAVLATIKDGNVIYKKI